MSLRANFQKLNVTVRAYAGCEKERPKSPLTPSLSPSDGERVAEDRVRGFPSTSLYTALISVGLFFFLWSGLAAEPPLPTGAPSTLYLECLKDFEPHAESLWHEATFPNAPTDSGYFGDGKSTGNGGIRGSCSVAIGYAVLIRAYPKDPRNAQRLARIAKVLNYAANTHLSGPADDVCVNKKRWGHLTGHGQTGLWAANMGLACILVEKQLPTATVAAVRRAVADEATFQSSVEPGNGYIGDTQAEENSWNSNIMALGAAWMPDSTNAPLWLTSAKKFLANSYTVANTNSDPLADWITTVTLFPSYAVENHGFYHPSYQLDPGASMGDSWLLAQIVNPRVARDLEKFAEHNVLNVWRHLGNIILDSGELGYPSGLDWSLHTYEHNTYFAWLATHFNEPLGRWTELQQAKLLRYRQKINGDGRFIGDSLPDGFYHEALLARHVAISWLHHQYGPHPKGPMKEPAPAFAHSADVKLITQRGDFGFFSLSYGSRVMGLVVPPSGLVPEDPYVTTPRFPGLVGLGALGPPKSSELLSLQTNASGFSAEFRLNHKTKGTTALHVVSTDGVIVLVEVPRPAPGVSESADASFCVGIENHKLTGGKRRIELPSGGPVIVAERSGQSFSFTDSWVCVSEKLGLIAGPAGTIHYAAADKYNRRGAAEDTLEFIPRKSFAPRFAIWLPGKNAAATRKFSSRVAWTATDTNATLTFPNAMGDTQQLVIPLSAQ